MSCVCFRLAATVVLISTTLFAQSTNPVPLVNLPLVPSGAVPSSADVTLTVNGTGFAAGSVVNWNGVPLATSFVNASRLKATIPSSNMAAPATASITVTNPAPGGGVSNVVPFAITTPSTPQFSTPAIVGTGFSLVVGDFNNDGKADLVVLGNTDSPHSVGTTTIYAGKGDGTFSQLSQILLPGFPSHAIAGDFNNDGNQDLVVFTLPNCMGCVFANLFLGNGEGAFGPGFTAPGVDGDYLGAVVGDFNRDGKLDFAASVYIGVPGVRIYLGRGDGTYSQFSGVSAPSVFSPTSVTTGDYNDDGILDLAVADSNPFIGDFAVFLLQADGTFSPSAFLKQKNDFTSNAGPQSSTSADFNGDGILDLATINPQTGELVISVGNGDGTFPNRTRQTVDSCCVTTADFDGDGILDLVVANGTNISVLLGNGDATFRAGIDYPAGGSIISVGTADFNGDGRADLVVARGDSQVVVLLQLAPTTTTVASSINPSTDGRSVTFTTVVTSGGGTPTGRVDFLNGSTVLATRNLVSGSAKYTTANLPAGHNSISVAYKGDSKNGGGTSIPLQQVVSAATTTTLASSPNPSAYQQSVTFTATVTSSVGPPPNGETITFTQGGTAIGTAVLTGGTATLSTSTIPVGTRVIKALYGGDASFAASTSVPVNQVVGKAASNTTIVSSLNPSKDGQWVTFTATVVPEIGGEILGTLTFYDGATVLRTMFPVAGSARFTTSKLTPGTHNIKATYNGSATLAGSSGSVIQTVN